MAEMIEDVAYIAEQAEEIHKMWLLQQRNKYLHGRNIVLSGNFDYNGSKPIVSNK